MWWNLQGTFLQNVSWYCKLIQNLESLHHAELQTDVVLSLWEKVMF
jgi:hypothetical protein